MKQIKKLLEYFTKMNFVEILGFGNMMGVEEEEEFESYVTNILDAFQKLPRNNRRKILKLAKEVAGD